MREIKFRGWDIKNKDKKGEQAVIVLKRWKI